MCAIGRTLTSGRGSMGKEVCDAETHRLHDAFEGAAGKTLEQDLPLLAQADAQARFAISVRGAARSPTAQRGAHALELVQDVVQRGRVRLFRIQGHRRSSFHTMIKACGITDHILWPVDKLWITLLRCPHAPSA